MRVVLPVRSPWIEHARGRWLTREQLAETLSAADGGQESDTVAAEVVEQPLVPRMSADHAGPAVVVAHQPMPVEIVRPAGRAGCANGRTCSSIVERSSPGKRASGS